MENLTASAIRVIIKACKENGVSRLRFGTLHVEFDQTLKQETQTQTSGFVQVEPEISLEQRARDKKNEFEDMLEEARLANPSLYEELIAKEEIDGADQA